MFDCAVIGSGPAGMSAVLNLKIRHKKYIWFGRKDFSSKVKKAERIQNYLGLCDVSGEQLERRFRAQVKGMELVLTEETVTGVYAMGEYFSLLTPTSEYQAKTVILATGVESTGKIEGEEKFLGRGVSYCATCDGALYKGKTLAVVCSDKAFENEVSFLCDLASKVYYFPLYKNPSINAKNMEILKKVPKKIEGNKRVEKLVFVDDELAIDGIFLLKNAISPAVLVGGLSMENGQVIVDKQMNTNLHGCFAAGDCTGRPYQYMKSAGEGNIASLSAIEYLDKIKSNL